MFIHGRIRGDMKTNTRLVGILALTLFVFLPSYALAASVDTVLKGLKATYSGVDTLSAAFTQVVSMKGAKSGRSASGKVWFKRPGMMRWVYELPEPDEIVGDGAAIWVYQPDLNQVIETGANEIYSSIAVDFLTGITNLEKGFKITLAKEGADAYLLKLEPRQELAGVALVMIEVDKKTGLVIKTVVEDMFGSQTVVSFTKVKTNEPVEDSFFKFALPKGATVVRP